MALYSVAVSSKIFFYLSIILFYSACTAWGHLGRFGLRPTIPTLKANGSMVDILFVSRHTFFNIFKPRKASKKRDCITI